MLNIDSIETHCHRHITAGLGMRIYELLELDKLDTCVAIIKNAKSEKYGKKDIIKIEGVMNIDLDVLGFIDDNATVCTIVNGKLQSKKKPPLPQRLVNVVSCKNPRCITRWRTWTRCSLSAMKRPTATGASTASRSIKNESEETLGYPAGQPSCSGAGRQYARKRPRRGSGAKLLLAFVTLCNVGLSLALAVLNGRRPSGRCGPAGG